ncbi:HET-domain-containing protein [Hypoxylon sp. FL1857]|nr:HET-domain-containing protein [Hypoxylon sp. FL1857]
MIRYKYTPLESPSRDIRLVTILPGKFDDPIRVKITHAQLDPPVQEDKPKRMSLKEIRQTLPEGCKAYETLEGRVIFNTRNEDGRWRTTWSHPDPSFPRDKYDPVDQGDAQSKLNYEALSYTWGSSKSRRTAIVEGSEPATGFRAILRTQRLRINRNLREALRYLRYEDDCRVMWIDAICIDQRDANERSEQVQRMGLIFSLARRVVAWLGPSSSSSGLAFSKLDYLGLQVEFTRDGWQLRPPSCDEPDWCLWSVPLPYDTDVWDAISDLCSRDWFSRLWVIQEIHLGNANSILKCGHDEILFSLFRRALICINGKDEGVPKSTIRNIDYLGEFCWGVGGNPFEETIYDFCGQSCEDDRDKIYGVMNLAPPEIATHIRVDYKQSATKVFEQAFLALAKQQRRLAQLQFSGRRYSTSTSTSPESPTWVPDWSRYVRITVPHNGGFCASGISALRAMHTDGGRLEVTARYFATVSDADGPIIAKDFSDVVKTYKSKIELGRLQELRYPTGDTYHNAWLQTLTLSQNRDRFPELASPTLAEISEVVTAEADGAAATGELSTFYRRLITSWVNGCLFETRNGYVGMIDGKPHAGDEVFIILGCDLPMLLRPTTTGEYEVVGDCYVHGIMDGEAILGPIPHPWRVVMVTEGGYNHAHYLNVDSERRSTEDPRLEEIPLPPEWEPIEWERTAADPLYCKKFRNRGTGEVINSDPRLFPEALTARGVPLRTITLV